jgi:hypothetical protein
MPAAASGSPDIHRPSAARSLTNLRMGHPGQPGSAAWTQAQQIE